MKKQGTQSVYDPFSVVLQPMREAIERNEQRLRARPACGCFRNPDTGFFEPCCEEHEREYVDYLEEQARLKEARTNA